MLAQSKQVSKSSLTDFIDGWKSKNAMSHEGSTVPVIHRQF